MITRDDRSTEACKRRFLLIQARKRRLWTAKEAAEQVGVTLVTYLRWERGKQRPRSISLKLLCKAFELSPEELGFSDLPQ